LYRRLPGRTDHVAKMATAFVVHRLKKKWKQPIGHFFTSSAVNSQALKELIISTIDTALRVGLQHVVLICDQGSNNRSR